MTRASPAGLAWSLGLVLFLTAVMNVGAAAYVRLNQVGYITTEPKQAILISSIAQAGSFSVINTANSSNVFTASLPATSLGSWSASFPDTYLLDFSAVTNPGVYQIQVTATTNATSISFPIGTATALYSPLLTNALFYYQSSRDGPNVITNVISRHPAHRFDTNATTYLPPHYASGSLTFSGGLTNLGVNIDASGGWFDAGDFLKFVETTSYVEGMLLFTLRDYPNRLNAAGDFTGEIRFGLDWLLKMWDQTNQVLYYQVSIGDGNGGSISGDHDVWRLPEQDDQSGLAPGAAFYYAQYRRPVFRAGAGGALISPNLAGRMAATFALASQDFRATDAALANRCLLAAQTIFDLANTNWSGNLLTASPYDYYPETSWHDDLEWGATELYLAMAQTNLPSGLAHTNAAFYLSLAAYWANQYMVADTGSDSLNLYDTSALAHYDLCRALALAGNPGGLATTQTALRNSIKAQLDAGVTQAAKNPFGFSAGTTYTGDPVPHGLCYAITANLYKQLAGANTYEAFGRLQRDFVLGRNSWGTTFIVGAGQTFPHCMQDQIANLAGSTTGVPPLRLGATVDGPYSSPSGGTLTGMITCDDSTTFTPFNGTKAVYKDGVAYSDTVEPTLDYTAPTVLLFAQLMGELTNAAPAPVLQSPAYATDSGFAFNLAGGTGSAYVVQASSDLTTTNWVALRTNTAPFGFTDSAALVFTQRFYRAVSSP